MEKISKIKKISRQRKWQLLKKRDGKCHICGKGEIFKYDYCKIHFQKHKMYSDAQLKTDKWKAYQKAYHKTYMKNK